MTLKPSDVQRQMYEFIVNYMKKEGMPPTNREIGREMQIVSTGHVDYHLAMLEKKGLIVRHPRKSRGIKLNMPTTTYIPVMGVITTESFLDIFPTTSQTIELGNSLIDSETSYALLVKGHSLTSDFICDADYVIIKPQSTCQNGDIIVAMQVQNGISGRAALKRFFREDEHDKIRLQSVNNELEADLIPKDIWNSEWQIQGVVTLVVRKFAKNETLDNTLYPKNNSNKEDKTALEEIKKNSDELSKLVSQKTDDISSSKIESDDLTNKFTSLTPEEILKHEQNLIQRDNEIIRRAKKISSLIAIQEEAYKNISVAAKDNREQLKHIYEQGHLQAKHWFQFGLLVAIIGFFIILAGAVVVITTGSTAGILTSLASIVPGAVSTLFFQQAREANKRVDDFHNKLIEIEVLNKATEITLTASDDAQDAYKGLIILRLLGFHSKEQEISIQDLLSYQRENNNLTLMKGSNVVHKQIS